jgi:Mg/Co/Ni transporter MgtE
MSRKSTTLLITTSVVIIAAIAFFTSNRNNPTSEQVSGAIGTVDKYRSEQITPNDVAVDHTPVEDIFGTLFSDPATLEELGNSFGRLSVDERVKLYERGLTPEMAAMLLERGTATERAGVYGKATAEECALILGRLTPAERNEVLAKAGITDFDRMNVGERGNVLERMGAQGKSDFLAAHASVQEKATFLGRADVSERMKLYDRANAGERGTVLGRNDMTERVKLYERSTPEQRSNVVGRLSVQGKADLIGRMDLTGRTQAFGAFTPQERLDVFGRMDLTAKNDILAKANVTQADFDRMSPQGRSDVLGKLTPADQADFIGRAAVQDRAIAFDRAPAQERMDLVSRTIATQGSVPAMERTDFEKSRK